MGAGAQSGWTSLHAATDNGRLEVVQLLLDNGAGVNAKEMVRAHPLSIFSCVKCFADAQC